MSEHFFLSRLVTSGLLKSGGQSDLEMDPQLLEEVGTGRPHVDSESFCEQVITIS